jgi:hypothetical protein
MSIGARTNKKRRKKNRHFLKVNEIHYFHLGNHRAKEKSCFFIFNNEYVIKRRKKKINVPLLK